jgi:hypothetical protein
LREVAQRLWNGLEASKNLDVAKHKKVTLGKEKLGNAAKAKVYKVRNSQASRKVTSPPLKSMIMDSETSEKEKKRINGCCSSPGFDRDGISVPILPTVQLTYPCNKKTYRM